MTRQLLVSAEATANIQTIYSWIANQSKSGADRWYDALTNAIREIESDGERFSIAPESARFEQ